MGLSPTIALRTSELPRLARAVAVIDGGRRARGRSPVRCSRRDLGPGEIEIGLRDLAVPELDHVLDALTDISAAQIARGEVPAFPDSHVRYQREPRGQERWQTARESHELGYGDCEDLSVFLAGTWRAAGRKAHAITRAVKPGLRHALVIAGRGQVFDPSLQRGMRGPG